LPGAIGTTFGDLLGKLDVLRVDARSAGASAVIRFFGSSRSTGATCESSTGSTS
jgi:hypothetical protein